MSLKTALQFRPGTYLDWRRDPVTGDFHSNGFWVYETADGHDLELIKFLSDTEGEYQSVNLGRYANEDCARRAAERFEFMSTIEQARHYPQAPAMELMLCTGLAFLFGAMIGAGVVFQYLGN